MISLRCCLTCIAAALIPSVLLAQPTPAILLKPERVFDGNTTHTGWVVVVKGEKIIAAQADAVQVEKDTKVISLPGMTLMPGLIDAHSHLLLYPYDQASWNDQVLKEPLAERICRATAHAKADLLSGFTTLRDLGTEGAGFADVGIKSAIQKELIPGPRVSSAKVGGFFVQFDVNWNIVGKNAVLSGGFHNDRYANCRTGSPSSTTRCQDEGTGR